MNGLCYLVPLDFNRNNIKKIPALIDRSKQAAGENKWVYGMGCMGSSAHYTKSVSTSVYGSDHVKKIHFIISYLSYKLHCCPLPDKRCLSHGMLPLSGHDDVAFFE